MCFCVNLTFLVLSLYKARTAHTNFVVIYLISNLHLPGLSKIQINVTSMVFSKIILFIVLQKHTSVLDVNVTGSRQMTRRQKGIQWILIIIFFFNFYCPYTFSNLYFNLKNEVIKLLHCVLMSRYMMIFVISNKFTAKNRCRRRYCVKRENLFLTFFWNA